MIIITGDPRSGTSLMMSIVSSLGIEIAGQQFVDTKQKSKKRIKRADYLNPEGFWEVAGVVSRGIQTQEQIDEYENKAIKIVTSGLLNTVKPAIDKTDKIIFCLRNPREIAFSQQKLISSIEVAGDNGEWGFIPEKMKVDLTKYIRSVGRYIIKSTNIDLWDRTLVVDYGELLTNPTQEIKRISTFLGVPYNPDTETLINKDLYRSVKVPETNELAENIYQSLLNMDFSEVIDPIKTYLEGYIIENRRWLDDTEFKTWVIGSWVLHKSLITNNNNVRTNLVKNAMKRKLPTQCDYYDPTGEEYTIERVKELGPLTRTKIKCADNDKELMREGCFNCWQHKLMTHYKGAL